MSMFARETADGTNEQKKNQNKKLNGQHSTRGKRGSDNECLSWMTNGLAGLSESRSKHK